MLAASRLSFAYGSDPVLDDVTVEVAHRDVVGILGPNGSGKTTLLKLLAGSLTPASGCVTLDGRALDKIPRRELARRVAVVPQETHLAFDYTVLEIALMGRYPWLGAFEIEGPSDLAAAADALDATGTAPFARRAFPTLSGGEKQRVIIASALAQLDDRAAPDPHQRDTHRVLLLDEPTASLDLRYQLEIGALVGRLRRDRDVTIVLSSHDLRLVGSVCSSLILLSHGRVLATGPTRELLTPEIIGELYEVRADLAAPLLP
ncbi:MAG: ABC transporter ATP-binding protein [Acidobacteriota bacterium]